MNPSPSDIIAAIRAAQRAVPGAFRVLLRWILDDSSTKSWLLVAAVAAVLALTVSLGFLSRSRREKRLAVETPVLLASWLVIAAAYACAWAYDATADPSVIQAPYLAPNEASRVTPLEYRMFGGTWLWPVMPLADRPAVALILHLALWGPALVALHLLLRLALGTGSLPASRDTASTPSLFRWTGCSTTQGVDVSVRAWCVPLTLVLGLVLAAGALLLTGSKSPGLAAQGILGSFVPPEIERAIVEQWLSLAYSEPPPPPTPTIAPGAYVLLLLLFIVLVLHILMRRVLEPPTPETARAVETPAGIDALAALREAVPKVIDGGSVDTESAHELPERKAQSAEWPSGTPASIRRAVEAPWGKQGRPHVGQAEVMRWILDGAKRRLPAEPAAMRGRTADAEADDSALVLFGEEGAGRSTTLLAGALLSALETGGSSLIVCRDRPRLEVLRARIEESLEAGGIRWTLSVAAGGSGLLEALASERLPSVVLVDMRSLDEELLLDRRADRLLMAIELVLVDELHEFVGAPEMNAMLLLRRLWLALDHLPRRATLPPMLVTAGTQADATVWVRGMIGRPARAVFLRGARSPARVVLRRRSFVTGAGVEVTVSDIARACEQASLPWHLRMSGDGRRSIQRANSELRISPQHRVDDPARAAVVILEGAFGEVEQEVHATALLGRELLVQRAVQIAASPVEEEVALEPLRSELPWLVVPLVAPEELCLAHAVRAVHSRPILDSALRDRLLAGKTGSRLDAWVEQGVLHERKHLRLPPGAFQPEADRLLSRAPRAEPLGEFQPRSVTGETSRLFDVTAGVTLKRIDAQTAEASFYPGAVLLLPQGRFRAVPQVSRWRLDERSYAAVMTEEAVRSVAEKRWSAEGDVWRLSASDRCLGSRVVRCRSGGLSLSQSIRAARLYGPDRGLRERREFSPPIDIALTTQVLLLGTGLPASAPSSVSAPVISVLSTILSSTVRNARELIWVGALEHGAALQLAFVDAVPGGCGVAAVVDDTLLAFLLRSAWMALSALPAPLQDRVRAWCDETTDPATTAWDVAGALAWLGGISAPPDAAAGVQPLPAQPLPGELAEKCEAVFPALRWYPAEEKALFLEFVSAAVARIPMVARQGANPGELDRLNVAAGIAAVFYRRPDLHFPEGFYVAFEPGDECHGMPGAAGYCKVGADTHVAVALEPLRQWIALDAPALVSHEAAHLLDALDGTMDGLAAGMTPAERALWMRGAVREMVAAARGRSLLREYAGTHPTEFLSEAVEAFLKRPVLLRDRLPGIYGGLRSALRQDPAAWAVR